MLACLECGTRYAPAERCPHCGANDPIEAWKVDQVELTAKDYRERLDRVEDGTATDDDRRLIKHYQREGFDEPAPAEQEQADEPAPERPLDSDDKAKWKAFADRLEPGTDHSKMTKPDLIAEFGDPSKFGGPLL